MDDQLSWKKNTSSHETVGTSIIGVARLAIHFWVTEVHRKQPKITPPAMRKTTITGYSLVSYPACVNNPPFIDGLPPKKWCFYIFLKASRLVFRRVLCLAVCHDLKCSQEVDSMAYLLGLNRRIFLAPESGSDCVVEATGCEVVSLADWSTSHLGCSYPQ